MKNLVAALTLRLVDRLSQPSRSAASAIGGIERAQRMAFSASAQWNRGLDELDEKLNRLASASLVTEGLGRAGEAMMRPLRRGVGLAAEFGQGMTGIGITAQMTDRQLQPMRRTILETASEIGALPSVVQSAFSSVLAEGVYKTEADLTRAGRSVAKFQQLAATMRDPISGDEAGGLSAGLAKSFNISADRLDQANAMLNRASQRGGVGIGVAARFFPAAAASMRGLGGDNERGLSDLMAATQVSKGAAGGSEQAANNLANLLSALTSPETLRNFSKMGVNLEKEIKSGLERGISPLETAAVVTDRLTKGGDQFRLGELFGDRQARDGIMALVEGLDEFRSISSDLRSEGLLQSYYADLDRAMQGPAASFGRYTSGMSRLGIAVGTILAPAVGLAADALTSISTWMSNASENGSLLAKVAVWTVAGFAGFAVAAGAVGHAVIGVLGPLFIMRTLFGTMGGAALKGMAANVIGGFARMRMAAIAFNLSMLANPIVLAVAAAVAAVALVAVVVRKYWQPISAFFGGVGQALGEAFGPALSSMGSALAPLKPLWDGLTGAVSGFFGWVGRLLQPMQATQSQLDGATNAGRTFGRVLVMAFNLSPIGLFVRGIRAAFQLSAYFANLRQQFFGFGGQIIRGLVAGVLARIGSVASAVGRIGSAAVTALRNRLGIRSPSRVFAGLGSDTMAGLTMGLGRGGRNAVATVAAVGAAMIGALPSSAAPAEPGASVPAAPAAASSGAAGGAGRVMVIERIDLTVQVQLPPTGPRGPRGGPGDPPSEIDAGRFGREIGRAAADALRARLFDGED